MRVRRSTAALLLAAALAAAPSAWARTPTAAEDLNPEAASGSQARTLVRAPHYMMVAANPLATAAGDEMLKRGGSVVDAAIATQLVLNPVSYTHLDVYKRQGWWRPAPAAAPPAGRAGWRRR